MRKITTHPTLRTIALIFFTGCIAVDVSAQIPKSNTEEKIAVTARPSSHSILLRWAPLSFNVWRDANIHGYRVERYVLTRNGHLLLQPERTVLATILKPRPEESWEELVHADRYAAIAAQALYGDRFEINSTDSDAIDIVNKVHENEQRFAFALFSADMSPNVARASGLWLADTVVNLNEKYLYRVTVNGADSLRGSIFISPTQSYRLDPPQNLKADFGERVVSLRWDHAESAHYTAYKIERSRDGIRYEKVSETPLVTVSPNALTNTRYEYATDSLPDTSGVYYYRVKGVTPFGEESPASEVVSGRSIPAVESLPFISSAESFDNVTVNLRWEFNSQSNVAIQGFVVERASHPKADYVSLTKDLLSPETRSFEDPSPEQTNYYRVSAKGLDHEWYRSHVYFFQLVDSIPPAQPSGLQASVDDSGKVVLSWTPNIDRDIYGYRIYKAHNFNEEPAQITVSPVRTTTFRDSVNLKTLNENVFYTLMAVDINQNHSLLSEPLKVDLPDIVKPQPAVFLPVRCDSQAITVSWIAAASSDIKLYKVYRSSRRADGWRLLETLPVSGDTIYTYSDATVVPGETAHYTVVSIDDAGLESEPAPPVSGLIPRFTWRNPVTWKKAIINREENLLTISWEYQLPGVESFKIFRSTDTHPAIHYKIMGSADKNYTDNLIPGRLYKYRIMAVFLDGSKSAISEELEFEY